MAYCVPPLHKTSDYSCGHCSPPPPQPQSPFLPRTRTGGCEGAVQPEQVPYPQLHTVASLFRLSNTSLVLNARRRTRVGQVEDDVDVQASIFEIRAFPLPRACAPSDPPRDSQDQDWPHRVHTVSTVEWSGSARSFALHSGDPEGLKA